MAHTEVIVGALLPVRERGQAVFLADGAELLAASGQDLVRVGLVTHVPDQAVFGRVEDVVQGEGQFHHAKARAEMAPGLAYRPQQEGAQFARKRHQLVTAQRAQLLGRIDTIQQGGLRALRGYAVENGLILHPGLAAFAVPGVIPHYREIGAENQFRVSRHNKPTTPAVTTGAGQWLRSMMNAASAASSEVSPGIRSRWSRASRWSSSSRCRAPSSPNRAV